jgi:hypothetical protein
VFAKLSDDGEIVALPLPAVVGVVVDVGVGVRVAVLVGVCVAVLVGVFVGVLVAVLVLVGLLVGVWVGVFVDVLVGVAVLVGVCVAVAVLVVVPVAVRLGVLVALLVGVGGSGVSVAVGVGVICPAPAIGTTVTGERTRRRRPTKAAETRRPNWPATGSVTLICMENWPPPSSCMIPGSRIACPVASMRFRTTLCGISTRLPGSICVVISSRVGWPTGTDDGVTIGALTMGNTTSAVERADSIASPANAPRELATTILSFSDRNDTFLSRRVHKSPTQTTAADATPTPFHFFGAHRQFLDRLQVGSSSP